MPSLSHTYHGGIVGELVIDDDSRSLRGAADLQVIEDLGQLAEPELGPSTTAARVLREADGGVSLRRHPGYHS
jgi:hypothetical protein